jgi:hypothetical protein
MNWQESWERDKYEVGRAMHEGWKRQKIANDFADHPLVGECQGGILRCADCFLLPELHHADMIDWDALPPEQQAINYEGGREGYRMGYEAGYRQGEVDEHGHCPEHGYVSCEQFTDERTQDIYQNGYVNGVEDGRAWAAEEAKT